MALPLLRLPPNDEEPELRLGMNELAGVRDPDSVDGPPKLRTVVRVELWRAPKLPRVSLLLVLFWRCPPNTLLVLRLVLDEGRCTVPEGCGLVPRVPKLEFDGAVLRRPPKLLLAGWNPCWRLDRAKSNPRL